MKFLKKSFLPIVMFATFGLSSNQALADSATGTVAVSMTLTSSCIINGAQATNGSSFGNLEFGSQMSLFTNATAKVTSTSGGTLSIQCNSDSATAPTVTLVGGANDSHKTAGYNHAMANGSKYISYSLYSDNAYSSVIAPNSVFFTSANDGSSENIDIYAKAVGASGLTTGTYTDTLSLQIDF